MRTPIFALCAVAAVTAQARAGGIDRFKPASVGSVDAQGVYRMSAEEEGYDCKKLTGRMQVRILDIRDYEERRQSTGLSQGLQSMAATLFGANPAGADLDGRYKADRAMLETYNGQLAAKNCRTFDLDAELRPKPVIETPTPAARSKSP